MMARDGYLGSRPYRKIIIVQFALKNFTRAIVLAAVISLTCPVPTKAVTFVLNYDSSVTSLPNTVQIQGAINYAAQQIQGLVTDPVTVYVNVTAAPGLGSGPGSAFVNNAPGVYSYLQIRSALAAHATSPYQFVGLASLPSTTDPFKGAGFVVPRAQAKLLGLIGASSLSDGTMTFWTGFNYALDPNNRAVPNQYDMVGLAEHQLTHILGRISGVASSYYEPMDVYRYNGVSSRAYTYGFSDYFSLNSGNTIYQYYDPPSDANGDTADWSYAIVGDAFSIIRVPNLLYFISSADVAEMSGLGYAENTATVLPAITSATAATATAGQVFSYTIAATNTPASFGVTTGLPAWLTVNQTTGVVSGIAPASGTFPMLITASNAVGTGSATLTITVGGAPPVTDAIGGTPQGGGWSYSTWFGYYNINNYPWIYRADLGFIYVSTTNSTDFYMYVQNGSGATSMGWIYTSPTTFPNVYSFTKASWLYFSGNTSFYNYTTGTWEFY